MILADDNPLKHIERPVVTIALIAACVVVFVGQLADLVPIEGGAMVPRRLAAIWRSGVVNEQVVREGLTLVTAMFMHGDVLHLLGNMIYLWVFGDNVEDALGHRRYLMFYLLTGITAGVTHIAVAPGSAVPTLGASGAISGVMGAYLVLYPRAMVYWRGARVPAFLALGVWILLQFVLAAVSPQAGIAWWAHIGGFGAGLVLGLVLRRR